MTDIETRRAYGRRHYQEHKALYKARAKAHTAASRQEVRAWLLEYLLAHPCVDCGEADPVVLEFDHRDPRDKSFTLGNAVSRSFALSSIRTEVAKCDVRCANCHRRKTYRDAGRTSRGVLGS